MKTILFSYEFGAGLGHLNRLAAVAKRLSDEYRLVFALPDLELGAPVLNRSFRAPEIHQGPQWPAPSDLRARSVPTHTFADAIHLFGFAQPERLLRAARQAVELIDEIAPDLIVGDFAPTLRIAALGRVPTVIIGNGYTVPPGGRPLPPMRPWESTVPPQSRAHEAGLLAAVNRACGELSRPAIDFFSDSLQGETTFVCTLREFDPYQEWRTAPHLWPFNIPRIAHGEAFSERKGYGAFCYLQRGHPSLQSALAALSRLSRPAAIYVQGADPRAIARACSRNVAVFTKPADYAEVLPQAAILLHHAGLGTAYAGLAAAVPQLVLPLNLEHLITTRGLQAFGVAVPSPKDCTAQDLLGTLESLLRDEQRQLASIRAATELECRREEDSVGRVVETCRGYLT